ncbi:hypothetical protein SLS62_004502 [Diatrype stigma]|uniref:ASST-domain-containing protein n=1 Tax=Diatrype stigma TaxID=117547 RepID=A0AAN9UUH9_9PEZI
MSDDNELVWQGGSGDFSAFRAQTFEGKPVLTFFNGVSLSEPYGWGHGIIQILDSSYESIYNVSLTAAEEGFVTIPSLNSSELVSYLDLHEALITPQDTILVTVYNVTRYDLSSVGGPEDGWVANSLFYELDIKTNKVLFRWSALDNVDSIPISDVSQFYPVADFGKNHSLPYGYFHINSVDKFRDGSYLISSRYYCSLFKISRNGTVEWTLQGMDGGDFELNDGLSFCYQHDARIHEEAGNTVRISIFNNENSDVSYGTKQTTGVFMTLNTETMTATLDKELTDTLDTIYSGSQGNTQQLDDGHVIVGYGSIPKIREYSLDGSPVMTAQFGAGNGQVFSYRAYRLPWVGRPKTLPSAFACMDKTRNETRVYMSWNGATEHEVWEVFAGATSSDLVLAAQVERSGFETLATLPGQTLFIRAEAQGPGIDTGVSAIISAEPGC